jgi:hypothetical protein
VRRAGWIVAALLVPGVALAFPGVVVAAAEVATSQGFQGAAFGAFLANVVGGFVGGRREVKSHEKRCPAYAKERTP